MSQDLQASRKRSAAAADSLVWSSPFVHGVAIRRFVAVRLTAVWSRIAIEFPGEELARLDSNSLLVLVLVAYR